MTLKAVGVSDMGFFSVAKNHSGMCYADLEYERGLSLTPPHLALDGRTPDGAYFDNLPGRLTVA